LKNVKKTVFFIVAAFILALSYLTIFGVYTYYGDTETVRIRGVQDIRWGIDIRGGVDVMFIPAEDYEGEVTRDMIDAARSVIETRMISKNYRL
jgi:preprotein translocase subunit SecD